jgi:uncharacterized protein YegP (UPF0339 family)
MVGRFGLYKDSQGTFRFRHWAGNGEIIVVGEASESKSEALNGVDSVRRNARRCRTRPAPAVLGSNTVPGVRHSCSCCRIEEV